MPRFVTMPPSGQRPMRCRGTKYTICWSLKAEQSVFGPDWGVGREHLKDRHTLRALIKTENGRREIRPTFASYAAAGSWHANARAQACIIDPAPK